MGYYTDLSGELTISPPLTAEQAAELNGFLESEEADWWLTLADDGTKLESYEELSGDYEDAEDWIEKLIEKFFQPWGCMLNGAIHYSGSDGGGEDRGVIHVRNNQTQAIQDVITSPDPVWGDEPKTAADGGMYEFIAWLEETLIPDLEASGTVETAADFKTCIAYMRQGANADLLTACEAMADVFSCHNPGGTTKLQGRTLGQARAAIARAKGAKWRLLVEQIDDDDGRERRTPVGELVEIIGYDPTNADCPLMVGCPATGGSWFFSWSELIEQTEPVA